MTITEHANLYIQALALGYLPYISINWNETAICNGCDEGCPASPSCLELSENRNFEAFQRNWLPVYQYISDHYSEALL